MYFLGIDAGGSKSEMALGDETQLLARTQTGSIKLGRVTASEIRENFQTGVREVCGALRIAATEIAACCVGFSGVSRPELVAMVEEAAREALPNAKAKISVVGDYVVAHRAAFPDVIGVLTIAGTGSICYGRNSQGTEARAGGYGPVVSDEGSGSWIGREAVRLTMRAHDGGNDPGLLKAILADWKLADLTALVGHVNQIAPAEFAALYPTILRAAEAHDGFALALLRDAAVQLAELTATVARRLDVQAIAFMGGVAESSPYLGHAFAEEMRKRMPLCLIREGAVHAAEGALRMAREMIATGGSAREPGSPTDEVRWGGPPTIRAKREP
jgi:N-acetylglucosamine kinase-like BadF-type ATPase